MFELASQKDENAGWELISLSLIGPFSRFSSPIYE
jgi:hypothetical protein